MRRAPPAPTANLDQINLFVKKYSVLLLLLSLAGCELITPPIGNSSVISSVPADGAENVSPGAAVKLQLDLPNGGINLTSANENSVTLTNDVSGQVVSATVRVDNDSERLTLTPIGPLEFATKYRFDLTNIVEDEAGQALASYRSTFTTLPDGVPAVVGSRPIDGETNVSVYDTSAINNDLNGVGGGVDPASLTSSSVYLTNLSTGERVLLLELEAIEPT